MNILVVNDDGIDSPGIMLLAKTLMKHGNVFVVAPFTEQSGIGHGITLHNPMKLRKRDDFYPGITAWSLDGKPADCIKFALYALELEIDLVVSGINNGPNLGTDIIYSGTIAGASEGVICEIPSIAVSADFGGLDIARRELADVLDTVFDKDILDEDIVININFPQKHFENSKGIRVTEQGLRPFLHEYVMEGDKYWARGTWDNIENDEDTDVYAYENGYISITPIQIDRTNYDYLSKLKAKF